LSGSACKAFSPRSASDNASPNAKSSAERLEAIEKYRALAGKSRAASNSTATRAATPAT